MLTGHLGRETFECLLPQAEDHGSVAVNMECDVGGVSIFLPAGRGGLGGLDQDVRDPEVIEMVDAVEVTEGVDPRIVIVDQTGIEPRLVQDHVQGKMLESRKIGSEASMFFID